MYMNARHVMLLWAGSMPPSLFGGSVVGLSREGVVSDFSQFLSWCNAANRFGCS